LSKGGSGVRGLLGGVEAFFEKLGFRGRRDASWRKVLAACQDEIASLSYYAATYRREEMCYWLPIPAWIAEDGSRGGEHKTLDIGCGYGTLAVYSKKVLGGQVYCIDRIPINYFLTEKLVRREGLEFAEMDIELEAAPWDVRFDTILFTEVLEHLNFHPLPTLEKIRGMLSEGGRVYLSTPDASEWGRVTKHYGGLDEIPDPGTARGEKFIDDHVYLYTKEELTGLVGAAGFEVSRLGYAPGVPGTHGRHLAVTLRAT
jgi:SAM-dependent methyltransferase